MTDRRKSLPTRSQPRPSRLSLAPARGILKRRDTGFDDNNTVIGVVSVQPQSSIPGRRVSFAPERVDIYSRTSKNDSSPAPSSPRRSPRLAAKRDMNSSSVPEVTSPTRSPRRKRAKLSDTALKSPQKSAPLIDLADDDTANMSLTLPFTIRADQSPLRAEPVKRPSFSNALNDLSNIPRFPEPSRWASLFSDDRPEVDNMEFTKPLRSPRKKLIQRIDSMSPRKVDPHDEDMELTFHDGRRLPFHEPRESTDTNIAKSLNSVQLTESNEGITVSDYDSDMDMTRPIASETSEDDSDMEMTRAVPTEPRDPIISFHTDRDSSDMDMTFENEKIMEMTAIVKPRKSSQANIKRLSPSKDSRSILPEDDSEMEITKPFLPAQKQLAADESDMEITRPMRAVSPLLDEEDMEMTKQIERPIAESHHPTADVSEMEMTGHLIDPAAQNEKTETRIANLSGLNKSPVKTTGSSINNELLTNTNTLPTMLDSSRTSNDIRLVTRDQDIIRGRTISDMDYNNITVPVFLSKIGIEFMDTFLAGRRNHSSIGMNTNVTEAQKDRDPQLADYVVAGASHLPLLNMYEFASKELKADNEIVKESFAQWEKDTARDNPVLFQEFMEASPATREIMKSQFQLLKSYSREEAKCSWYVWRAQLTRGVKKEIERNLEKLRADLSVLKPQLEAAQERHEKAQEMKIELQSKIKAARKRLSELRARRAHHENEDKDQHSKLKEVVRQKKQNVRIAQAELENVTEQAENVVARIERLNKEKSAFLDMIPKKEQEIRSLQTNDHEKQYRLLLSTTLFRKVVVDKSSSSVILEFLDKKLSIAISINGNVDLKYQGNDIIRQALVRWMNNRLSARLEPIPSKISFITQTWLKISEFCNELDRLRISLRANYQLDYDKLDLHWKFLNNSGQLQELNLIRPLEPEISALDECKKWQSRLLEMIEG